ncbi:MAG: hypothetical protein HKO07_01115, partial [Pseudomonadales bacterium]|nr:hypothetical protein [Pseudomonadales bacterium]
MTAPPGLPERAAHSRSFVLSLILLATLLAIACYSLLALQPAMADQRSQHELQNTGHLVLFGVLAFAACHSAVSGLKQVEFFRLLAGIVVLAAIAGLLTEYLQGLV